MKKTINRLLTVFLIGVMFVCSFVPPQGFVSAESFGGGATYYVSNDGEDANSGSLEAPYKTLAKGVSRLQPGDTLVIKAGDYSEALVLNGLTGTAQAPITIRGEAGVNITASAYVNAPFWKNFTLSITNSQYVNISDIRFAFGGTPQSGDSYTAGISGVKQVKLLNNRFAANSPAYAVFYLDTNNENLTIDGNYIEGSDNAFYGYGIKNTTVTNNIFTEWWTFHFEPGTSSNNVISNNVFAGAGEHFYGGTYGNSIITNNIFLGNPAIASGTGNTIGYNSVTGESYKTSSTDVVAAAADTFVSESDYHLKEGSPSIDTGTDIGMPQSDRDGNVRYGVADIGAYTYGKIFYLDANAPAGGNGQSEAAAFNNLADANAAITPGVTLLVKPGSYTGNITITGNGAPDTAKITIKKLGEGTVSMNGGSSPAVSLNNIANVKVEGLSLAGTGNSALLANGVINGEISDSTFTTAVHGIEITGNTRNSKFYNNTFKQANQKGILLKDSTANQIFNNIFENYKNILNEGGSFTNTLIMNNVFVSRYGDGANIILKGTDTGNTIANNIFRAEGPAAIQAPESFYAAEAGNTVDFNLYDSTGTGLTSGKPANETNSVYGNPMFVSDSDYHLQMGSAAINRGTNTNAPVQDRDGGVRFGVTDIGAYEYAGDSSAYFVVGQTPQGNGIPVNAAIRIVLSEKTNDQNGNIAGNIAVTTVVDGQTVTVPGSFNTEDDGTGTAITFVPAAALHYDSTYTVTIKKDLMSTNGNYLPADVSWSFGTEAFIMNEYYISPDGSDSNLGTIDSPKRTVSASLIAKLKAGDTVFFREGVYNGIIVLQSYSGTADKPITFKSYQNEKVVLTSDNPDYIIYLGHSEHIRIEGLTFAPNAAQNGSRGAALRIDNHTAGRKASSNITVTGNRFENSGTAIATRDLVNAGFGDFEFSNNVVVSNDSWGFYFQEVRAKAGSYGKIFNNVIYGASRSINLWGKSSNLLFYNNTFADTYDAAGGSGRYDLYPVQGTYDAVANPINISTNLVFKNNIFTKPIRTQLEGGKSIIDASQNVVFDNNVYSIAGTQRVTYNGGGEGPVLTLAGLQSGTAWTNQGRPLEVSGKFGTVAFVNAANDARIIFAENPAIGAADSSIVPGVEAPATDINGNTRTQNEAGAYAFDQTFAFVGENTGAADGSPLHPYPSISAAVNAGAKSIQVMAGSYVGEENIDMAASAGGGDVQIMPYEGEVIVNGPVHVIGTTDKAVSLQNLTFGGDVTVTGPKVTLNGNRIQGAVDLNQAEGAAITNNIFAPKAADAISINGSSNSLITNNVMTQRQSAIRLTAASTGNKLYNNTLYGNEKDVDRSGDSTGNMFKNNIFSTKIDSFADNEFDYNLYNEDTIASADLNAVPEAHAVKAPAEFINVKAKDYRIYKLSPAVGAGITDANTPAKDINGIARKNPSDIGAYAAAAIQVNYYVDAAQGDDAGSGTAEAPFKTISAALDVLRNGETVIVKAGAYDENITLTDRAGQTANDYVIKADGAVILNGSITLNNATGVTIDGFNVYAGNGNTAVSTNGSPKAALRNLSITNAKYGIRAINSPELSVNKTTIHHVEKGIVLDGAGKAEVTQSTVDHASANAIEAKNGVVLTMNTSLITNSAAGVLGTGESSFFMFNNTFYNNSGYSIDVTQAEGNATNLDVVNNIFSRSERGQGAFTRINKNGGVVSEYNLYDAAADEKIVHLNGTDQTYAETAANGMETKGRIGDPLFKDAANGNYQLEKGSAASRNGVKSVHDTFADGSKKDIFAPSADFAGTPYSALGQDIGAYYSPYSMKTIHLAGDNAGRLDGDGTAERPFRTFAQAVNAADSGDTIIVHKGIYTGRYDINDKHGAADAPIVIKASTDPNDPLDLANGSLPGPIFTSKVNYEDRHEEAKDELMTKITNSSNITIEGLYITGFRGAGIWTLDSDSLVLKNLKIWSIDTPQEITSGVQGLLINGTTNSLFKDIDIWDIGQVRKSQADHGAYIGHGANLVFDGIKVSNSPGGGMQFYAGDIYEIQSTDIVVKNSVFSESKYGLILVGIEGFTVTNNTFYNSWANDLYLDWNVRNNLFQNNIFYNDRSEEYNSVDGKVKPVIVGYQYNVVRTNPDQTTTDMVVGNTFRNNLYDYKTFPANAQFSTRVMPIQEFMASENATATMNRYTDMFKGNAGFKGSIASAADDYERAQKIFDNVLDITAASNGINKGESEHAPTVDILGRTRSGKPDLGAYEYPSNGGGETGGNTGGNTEGNSGGNTGGGTEPTVPSGESAGTVDNPALDSKTGVASAKMTAKEMEAALKSASVGTDGTKKLEIKLPDILGARAYSVELPNPAVAAADSLLLTVSTPAGTVIIPNAVLRVAGEDNLVLFIGASDTSVNGTRPAITFTLTQDGKPLALKAGNSRVKVALPYTPTAEERNHAESITVWRLDAQGKATAVPSARYDEAAGVVIFEADELGSFTIMDGFKSFIDLKEYEWAKHAVEVLASKGIIRGMSEEQFDPSANIRRGDFIALLVRALGLDAVADSNFDDVKPGDYYYEEIAIARSLGIATGVDEAHFNPQESISRQDMMVLTDRALRALEMLKGRGASDELDEFTDKSNIFDYAYESISTLVKEGIVSGFDGKLNPLDKTTRAEAAVLLYNIYYLRYHN
ncbi:right-handed parallel beta-helix repeat-containing protein [Paenibacillus contaminans]|uniref:SLH domain-containing protein n=1 Tax=Paenibacillus contaminans TaxID=450362 RepID=A0A329MTD8_9BACL|nr:right-handed parallel beta-helix repeat-containing protein [Paenibacillus contaminans]RAV23225.1 hypothetical protein DQG23_03265 [Paenibacillus contaminans]